LAIPFHIGYTIWKYKGNSDNPLEFRISLSDFLFYAAYVWKFLKIIPGETQNITSANL